MNMREAFKETLALARELGMDQASSDDPNLDYPHLVDMYDRIVAADEAGTPYNEGKLGRHLGWAQACVVASGMGATLDNMKEINMKWSEK